FKSTKTAYATIKRFEFIRTLRKGQTLSFLWSAEARCV
ncbi:UNVERIFIED_CONTAM: transposase, partial [Staphylococcus haemolyticus]